MPSTSLTTKTAMRGLDMARRNVELRSELYGTDSAAYGRGLTTLAIIERLSGMTSEALASLSEAETLYETLGETSAQARVDVTIQRAEISYEQGLLPTGGGDSRAR